MSIPVLIITREGGKVLKTHKVGGVMSDRYNSVEILCDEPSGAEEWLTFTVGRDDPRQGKIGRVSKITANERNLVTIWLSGSQSSFSASPRFHRNLV